MNDEELRWIKRAKKLLKSKPESLMLYTTDAEITVCKSGVPDTIYSETLANGIIDACCVVGDIHR